MADFSRLATQGAHAQSLDFSKAQSVQTGQKINFSKDQANCSHVRIELYWMGDMDGDASVVLLDSQRKALSGITDPTNPNSTRGMVWYKNLSVNGINHSGDARTSDNDPSTPEETIRVTLGAVDSQAEHILVVASTYPDSTTPNQAIPFGRFRDCKVMVINNSTNEVLYVYELDQDF